MNPIEYAAHITGWMRENELAWLAKTAASLHPGAVWLEVGTWMGRSWSVAALSLPKESTIISVDSFGSIDAYAQEVKDLVRRNGPVIEQFKKIHDEVRIMRPDLRTRIIAKPSVEAAKEIADRSCDAIFVDGNHTAPEVCADLRAWLPKLKAGGLMCGHDISDPGVVTALRGYKYKYDPNHSGSIWWMI